jgi:hypothetical protein
MKPIAQHKQEQFLFFPLFRIECGIGLARQKGALPKSVTRE